MVIVSSSAAGGSRMDGRGFEGETFSLPGDGGRGGGKGAGLATAGAFNRAHTASTSIVAAEVWGMALEVFSSLRKAQYQHRSAYESTNAHPPRPLLNRTRIPPASSSSSSSASAPASASVPFLLLCLCFLLFFFLP